jgi:hypothetical protein
MRSPITRRSGVAWAKKALGKVRFGRALKCQRLAEGGDQIGSSNDVEVKEEQEKDKQLF